MELQLKVFRFHPEKDLRPHYDLFSLEAEATDRVLDLLEMVRAEHDPTLAYRRSCAHGVCGSDAMRIMGKMDWLARFWCAIFVPGKLL